jgi:hypothetical protein
MLWVFVYFFVKVDEPVGRNRGTAGEEVVKMTKKHCHISARLTPSKTVSRIDGK